MFLQDHLLNQLKKEDRMLLVNALVFDAKWADYFREKSPLRLICMPGQKGAAFVSFFYNLAHRIVKFN